MILISAFGRTIAGFWRLLIGLLLGIILYIYTFLCQEEVFTAVHDFTRELINWIKVQPQMITYAKWDEFLGIDGKLAFALYILFARLVWLFFEQLIRYLYNEVR